MNERVIAIVLVAVGTYLARFLPLRFKAGSSARLKEFLALSSTSIISALFVTTTFTTEFEEMSIRFLALFPVILSYYRWRNFGISVFAGVVGYFMIKTFVT